MEPTAATLIPTELFQRFNGTYANLTHIHESLQQREGNSITDSGLEKLSISIDKIELYGRHNTVTPYFSAHPGNIGYDVLDDDYESDSVEPYPASYWLTKSFLFHQDEGKWRNIYEIPESNSSGSGQEDSGFESEDEESSEIEDTSDEDLDHGSEGSEETMPAKNDRLLVQDQIGESSGEEESEKESEEDREARRKRVREQRRQARMQAELRLATRQRYRWKVYHYPDKVLELHDNRHDFMILRTGNITNPLRCHQWAVATIDKSDITRPSITELLVLTSQMLKAIKSEKKRLRELRADESNHVHLFFPTIIFTFDQEPSCRVLAGYYDDGLKVHFSEPYTFESWVKNGRFPSAGFPGAMDNENYMYSLADMVDWAWPEAQRDTAQNFTVAQNPCDNEEVEGISPLK